MNADFQNPGTERQLWSVRALLALYLPGAMLIAANPSNAAEPKEQVTHLLQGNDRTPFYSFLKDFGVDKDPDNVFTLTNGVLHITGQYYGYLATEGNERVRQWNSHSLQWKRSGLAQIHRSSNY